MISITLPQRIVLLISAIGLVLIWLIVPARYQLIRVSDGAIVEDRAAGFDFIFNMPEEQLLQGFSTSYRNDYAFPALTAFIFMGFTLCVFILIAPRGSKNRSDEQSSSVLKDRSP